MADRLDTPRAMRRSLVRRPRLDSDAFGKWSERIARFLGTGRFLVYMTVAIAFWIGWNTFGPAALRFDNYPFIFLTLMLSLQASYAAPLILLAQNRQEARDKVQYQRDRAVDDRSRAEMDFLAREMASLRMNVGEVATRDFLRTELRALLSELDHRAGGEHSTGTAGRPATAEASHRSSAGSRAGSAAGSRTGSMAHRSAGSDELRRPDPTT